ncbi:MAG: hypothetical protein JJU29_14970 [Verrucomicrobia bacterium]|nr:hypothetical protein [Verrucomicrobiota bacterium]MCH8513289.1 hypothetical protein [Kiritimatiellia bacterium]
MPDKPQTDEYAVQWTPSKVVSLCGGCLLMIVCVILPLVGPAGRQTAHYWPQNVLTFLAVLLTGGLVSAWGWRLSLKERQNGKNALPRLSLGLLWMYLFLFGVFLTGGFQI